MRRPKKPSLTRRRNPLAKLVRSAPYRTRLKQSGCAYARKAKHPQPPDPEGG